MHSHDAIPQWQIQGNTGTQRSAEPNAGFARLREKRLAMIGRRDDAFANAVFDSVALAANLIVCPPLQLQGVPDQLFRLDKARLIHDAASAPDKTLVLWNDGDHCLYNHSHEKHCLTADWFRQKPVLRNRGSWRGSLSPLAR